MSLQQKVIKLRMDAAVALRHSTFWQKQIEVHGEEKATAFYKHLGLNHLEVKGVEWEGLTLSREPTEAEKIAVKGVASTQETAKESIGKILLKLRSDLITEGLATIENLEPADYHTLTLEVPSDARESLRSRLGKVFKQGRALVAAELGKKDIFGDEELEDLETLTDLTGARVINDVQSRIADAASRYYLLGRRGEALLGSVTNAVNGGTVSYIDRASTGLANKVISMGRWAEARSRDDEWDRVEYSAILDQNVCGPCASEDGKTGKSEDDLQPTPNPDCEGGDWCRCFHVWINQ